MEKPQPNWSECKLDNHYKFKSRPIGLLDLSPLAMDKFTSLWYFDLMARVKRQDLAGAHTLLVLGLQISLSLYHND